MHKALAALLLTCLATAATAQPATVRLPDSWCGGTDGIFADAFETGGVFTSDASQGSGGVWPGNSAPTFNGGSWGTQTYFVHVPPQYQPGQAAPLLVVLHGAAGSPAGALQAAENLRNLWAAAADTWGFIIAAPVANGSQGGWLAPGDYAMLKLMLADLGQAWNIERNRISLWGFSAGGFVAWDMLLGRVALPASYRPFTAASLATLAIAGANASFACANSTTTCNALLAALPRKVPVIMHIGNNDPRYSWAYDDWQRLMAQGWSSGDTVDFNVFVGGHDFRTQDLPDVAAFACRFAAQP